jgi:hypothetical protein
MTNDKKPNPPDPRANQAQTVKPHENPGPRGNPEIEHDSLEKGLEKLERVKPY